MTTPTSQGVPTVDGLPPLPEPNLHAHELLANGGGVWLGCNSRKVIEQAYDEEDTGTEIRALFTADQMRAYALDATRSSNAVLLRAREALELAHAGLEWYRDRCPNDVNGSDDEVDELIGAVLDEIGRELDTP